MQRTKKPEVNKIKTRQQIKKGKSKLCCRPQSTWLIIALLSHRYCTAIAPLSHQYCYAVALLLLLCRTAIAPVSLHCCSCCRSYCRYAFAPLSLCCRAVVERLSLRPREGIKNSILKCCCYTVTPLSLLMSIGRFTRLSPQEA